MASGDHRTRVTRLLIRRAFTGLLKEKPIQSISVKELCQRADISRGTFYAHYTDIYDLLGQLEHEMLTQVRQELSRMEAGVPEDARSLQVTASLFRCIRENADLCTVILGPWGDKEFLARLLSLGQEYYVEAYRKYFRSATPKQLRYFYSFVSGGCMSLIEDWIKGGMAGSEEELAQAAEQIMMHGVGYFQCGGEAEDAAGKRPNGQSG